MQYTDYYKHLNEIAFVKKQAIDLLPENKYTNIVNSYEPLKIEFDLYESRKFPHLNPKVSVADTILKLAERDDTFVSFRSILKAGLHPSSTYATPKGIYAYPAKQALKYYGQNDILGINFPFATEEKYVYIFVKKPNIKEINIDTYTKQDGEQDMNKLIKIYSGTFDEKSLINLKQSAPESTSHLTVDIGAFWYFCYTLSNMLRSKKGGRSSTHWTKILKADLGYDLVIDSGHGVIHSNEMCQAFFTNNNAFTTYTVIEKEKKRRHVYLNYNKIANNLKSLRIFLSGRKLNSSDLKKLLDNSQNKQQTIDILLSKGLSIDKILTDDIVNNLLRYSPDKQQIIDILFSKNVPLTDDIVNNLLIYSPDKQQTIDILLSKNILLTNNNVYNLLIYSPDKQQTIDILLSKNILLTNNNVYNLLRYSPDKQQIIDILFSKNVPLTHLNVNNLLHYSPNRKDTQQKIDALKATQQLKEIKLRYKDFYKIL